MVVGRFEKCSASSHTCPNRSGIGAIDNFERFDKFLNFDPFCMRETSERFSSRHFDGPFSENYMFIKNLLFGVSMDFVNNFHLYKFTKGTLM